MQDLTTPLNDSFLVSVCDVLIARLIYWCLYLY